MGADREPLLINGGGGGGGAKGSRETTTTARWLAAVAFLQAASIAMTWGPQFEVFRIQGCRRFALPDNCTNTTAGGGTWPRCIPSEGARFPFNVAAGMDYSSRPPPCFHASLMAASVPPLSGRTAPPPCLSISASS